MRNLATLIQGRIKGYLTLDPKLSQPGDSILQQWERCRITKRTMDWDQEGNLVAYTWRRDDRTGITVVVKEQIQ